jgi:hypothetical protein
MRQEKVKIDQIFHMAVIQKKKKTRMILRVFIALIMLLFVIVGIRLTNPYRVIIADDLLEPYVALRFYDQILSKPSFLKLIERLLRSNDIRTINVVARYCNDEKKCNTLPVLMSQAHILYQFPQDSIWTIDIDFSYSRTSSRKMLDLPSNLQSNIEKLRNNCSQICMEAKR